MQRHHMAVSLLALAAFAFGGCESVETTALIGQPVGVDIAEWSGTWQIEDQVIFLRAADDGTLRAAAVEWGDGEFQLKQLKCRVTTLDGRHYVHIPVEQSEDDADEPVEMRFSFNIVEHPESNVLVVLGAKVPEFRRAVEAGRLKGEVIYSTQVRDGVEERKPSRTILRDKESLDAFIQRTPSEQLFPRDEPLRLRRVVAIEPEVEAARNGD